MSDGDSATGNPVFYILQEAVSRERLSDLRIRVVAEKTLSCDASSEETVLCWVITKTGLRKLYRYGYRSLDSVDVGDSEDEHATFVALVNPDGSPARADVDPCSVHTVEIHNWNGVHLFQEPVKKIVSEQLIPQIKRSVLVCIPHNNVTPAVRSDAEPFKISVWASPTSGRVEVPSEMWRLRTPCTDDGSFGVWLEGKPIISPEGDEVGAFDEHNLFIYSDLFHSDNPAAITIFEKIIQYVVEHFKDGLKGTPIELVRKRYVTECSKRLKSRRTELKRTVDSAQTRSEELQRDICDLIREYRQAKVEYENFSKYEEKMKAAIEEEFDSLLKTPRVTGVDWRGDSLTVDISNIQVTDPRSGKLHDIGEFKILVDQRFVRVLFINKTRKVDGYSPGMNAPHVFPDGRPCLGTMESVIPKLVANYEWCALVHMCITFLESVNVRDSAGRHIDKWPVVEPAVEKEPEDKERKEAVAEVVSEQEQEIEETEEAVAEAATYEEL